MTEELEAWEFKKGSLLRQVNLDWLSWLGRASISFVVATTIVRHLGWVALLVAATLVLLALRGLWWVACYEEDEEDHEH